MAITINYSQTLSLITPDFIAPLYELACLVFDNDVDQEDFHWRLTRPPEVSVQIAEASDELVGFKIGHALSTRRYLSWLGGVHPDYRGMGIAMKLMAMQHEWIQSCGYQGVETSTQTDNLAMLQLNLKAGFEVIGSHNRNNDPRVILYKTFQP